LLVLTACLTSAGDRAMTWVNPIAEKASRQRQPAS